METSVKETDELRPRPLSVIDHQLQDLNGVIDAARAYGAKDFASSLALKSLESHQKELLHERRAALLFHSANDVELTLDGDPVRDHAIQARFLGNVLATFQQLANSLGQALTSVPTLRARFQGNVVAENRLLVTGFTPSSFSVQMRLPTTDELEVLYEPASTEMLKTLTGILNGDAFTEELTKILASGRIKKHYSGLLEMLANNGATLQVRTKQEPFGVLLTTRQARDRVEWLQLLQTDESVVKCVATLVGGNIERGRFELRWEDELIAGEVSESAVDQLKGISLGSRVDAELRVLTVSHEENAFEPKSSHILISIASVSDTGL